jgi:tight adherence protein C
MDFQASLLSAFMGVSIAIGIWAVIDLFLETLRGADKRDESFAESQFFKLALPFIQAIARSIERFRFLNGLRDSFDRRLVMAGKRESLTPDELIATCILGALIAFGVAWYFDYMLDLSGSTVGIDYAGVTLTGLLLPAMSLNDNIKRRHNKIRKVLPYTLDLVTLAVEAGLDFTAALSRIAEKLKGNPFQDEVRKVTRELAMGKTRMEALKDMSDRVRLEELRAVVSALVQADELGSPLGPVLRIQAEDLRRKRFTRAEKLAGEAPVKMLGPLIIFIFPMIFIVIFGPMGIRLFSERPF